jgi:hypothetical protein
MSIAICKLEEQIQWTIHDKYYQVANEFWKEGKLEVSRDSI